RLGIAALVLLAASLAGFGLRESIRVWQMRQELSALERDVGTLTEKQRALEALAERLRSDPAHPAKLSRDEVGEVPQRERGRRWSRRRCARCSPRAARTASSMSSSSPRRRRSRRPIP